MSSFFEKLKKGMGGEGAREIPEMEEEDETNESEEISETKETPEEEQEKKIKELPKERKAKKPKTRKIKKENMKKSIEIEEENNDSEKDEEIKIPDPIKEKNNDKKPIVNKKDEEKKDNWSQFSQDGEGQLAIDVYQTEDFLVIQSAIAGVRPDSLDIAIEGDMVTIKGTREKPEEQGERNYFYQECFWGPFSRQIVLSVEVDPGRTEATLKNGILTVKIPKIERERRRKIEVKG